jgi:hypothetical protein
MSFENLFEAYKIKLEKNFAEAVFDLHIDMSRRIFKEQKDINGNSPKPYDTKPIYASIAKYKGEVVLGGKKTKNGTGKSKYFEGGYSQLKRESGKPPIELFGSLKSNFSNAVRAVREVNPFEYEIVVEKENADKIKGNFVNFFKVSKTEKENLLKKINGD